VLVRSRATALSFRTLLLAGLLSAAANAQTVAVSYYHPFGGSGGPGICVGSSTPLGDSPLGLDFHFSYHHLAEVRTNDSFATAGWFSAHAIIPEFGVSLGLGVGQVLPYVRAGVAALFNVDPTLYQGQLDRDLAPSLGMQAIRSNGYSFTLGELNPSAASLNFGGGFYGGGGVEIPLVGGGDWRRSPTRPRDSSGVSRILLEVNYYRIRSPYTLQGSYVDPQGGSHFLQMTGSLHYDGLEFRISVGY